MSSRMRGVIYIFDQKKALVLAKESWALGCSLQHQHPRYSEQGDHADTMASSGLSRRRGQHGAAPDSPRLESSNAQISHDDTKITAASNQGTDVNHKIAFDARDMQSGEEQVMPKLTLMEEVLLLGLKDKQVRDPLYSCYPHPVVAMTNQPVGAPPAWLIHTHLVSVIRLAPPPSSPDSRYYHNPPLPRY